jgi:hypothetical protein
VICRVDCCDLPIETSNIDEITVALIERDPFLVLQTKHQTQPFSRKFSRKTFTGSGTKKGGPFGPPQVRAS